MFIDSIYGKLKLRELVEIELVSLMVMWKNKKITKATLLSMLRNNDLSCCVLNRCGRGGHWSKECPKTG